MFAFSKRSRANLDSCDPRIVEIFDEVIKHIDCTILEGARSKEDQNEYFRTGKSKVKWPNSKHNVVTKDGKSKAVDAAPYFKEAPHIRWDDAESFYYFAGFVQGIAKSKGYTLRYGGDWDGDWNTKNQTFFDLPHFEIVNYEVNGDIK